MHSLDEFLITLQEQVGSAQRAIEFRQEKLFRSYLGVNGSVKDDALGITLPIENKCGNGAEETIRLPMQTILKPVCYSISRLSFEFDAALHKVQASKMECQGNLVMIIRKRRAQPKDLMKRISITLEGPQLGRAKVFIDEVLLKTLELTEKTAIYCGPKDLGDTLLEVIPRHSLSGEISFLLSAEDSARILEITSGRDLGGGLWKEIYFLVAAAIFIVLIIFVAFF
ncbi:hypothetical protein SAMN04244579_04565 [Azotobacter beijerinckii]|uniref:Uncharacterized protein n=1 Tax=Azotobacter beijerinckii TaxID=170623 RepID=A0A1H6Z5F2_9GAMM|nr:hypothetical protein [Azotobacter beijerinckii]SEJ48661.1 hypothetical protein SAMN04244579_04565 [Azotobacter beijerinckii]